MIIWWYKLYNLLNVIINYLDNIPAFIISTLYPAITKLTPKHKIKNNTACLNTLYLGNTKCL